MLCWEWVKKIPLRIKNEIKGFSKASFINVFHFQNYFCQIFSIHYSRNKSNLSTFEVFWSFNLWYWIVLFSFVSMAFVGWCLYIFHLTSTRYIHCWIFLQKHLFNSASFWEWISKRMKSIQSLRVTLYSNAHEEIHWKYFIMEKLNFGK